MAKLSRAGWNNVIIFGVMGFILIINATNNNVFSTKSESHAQQYLLGENAVILTLQVSEEVSIQRLGTKWQATPEKITGQALAQMMRSWQQLEGELISAPEDVDLSLALPIVVSVANRQHPLSLKLVATDDQLLIFNDANQRWYVLPMALFPQLLPSEIFG
ncbi:hypothetical protein [Thalassotalea ganghwensis]